MSELKRIDQYLCIDIDKVIVDEMRYIIETETASDHPDDIRNWSELQAAAHVLLSNYAVPEAEDSEIEPTLENLTDPYVLQLIEALAKRDDEIERLRGVVDSLECESDWCGKSPHGTPGKRGYDDGKCQICKALGGDDDNSD